MPEVSVVLPCYNAGAFLPTALESLERQSFQDFVTLIVDDGSTDPATLRLLERLEAEQAVKPGPGEALRIIRQENKGLSAARNAGFRASDTPWVLPLDCDDHLDPAFLETALGLMRDHPEAGFVFAWLNLFEEKQGILKRHYNYFEQLFINQLPYCLFQPRRAWEAIGGYDETMRQGYEDWEYNIRLGRAGFFGLSMERPLFHYRVRGAGMLKAVSAQRHARLWRGIQDKHGDGYTWPALMSAWWRWRKRPSSYPLWIYFGMQLLFRLLPEAGFNRLFNGLRFLSASER